MPSSQHRESIVQNNSKNVNFRAEEREREKSSSFLYIFTSSSERAPPAVRDARNRERRRSYSSTAALSAKFPSLGAAPYKKEGGFSFLGRLRPESGSLIGPSEKSGGSELSCPLYANGNRPSLSSTHFTQLTASTAAGPSCATLLLLSKVLYFALTLSVSLVCACAE